MSIGAICFGAEREGAAPARAQDARPTAAANEGAKATSTDADKQSEGDRAKSAPPSNAHKYPADEAAIRQADDSFAKDYGQGDAKKVAAHFTADAEYVDELGNLFQGREAIEKSLTEFFAANPGCKMELHTDALRFVSPDVAVQDGHVLITHPKGSTPTHSRYTKVHVKIDGRWLAASARDHVPKDRREHRAQLEQLHWLIGDWVEEGHSSLVSFSCKPVDHGNFLLRKFTVHVAGQEAISGSQRIGWDPVTGKLRAWIFDSEGGYRDGFWSRDGDKWVLKITGVTAEGDPETATSEYRIVNAHTIQWQSLHHEIGGVHLPDSEVVTIVRNPPAPSSLTADRK